MKKLLHFLFLIIFIASLTSCVDEQDFDFDSLSQTTINPTINAPLINLEVSLSDFLDLNQLSDTANGFEIMQINEEGESFLQITYSIKDTAQVNEYTKQLDEIETIQINIAELSIPDLEDYGFAFNEIESVDFLFPDANTESEDISVEINHFNNEARIDSIHIISGNILIQPQEALPLNSYIELTSSSIKNPLTGELLSQRIQISNTSNILNQYLDLSNYTIYLKDTIIDQVNKKFVDLRYRLVFDLASNDSFQSGDYDINLNLAFETIFLDAVFGDLGECEFHLTDTIPLDFFQDSILNSIAGNNNIDLEKVYLNLCSSTNIGIDLNAFAKFKTITKEGDVYNLINEENTLHFNRAEQLGLVGHTNDIVLESDANAIEILPEKLSYDIKFNFQENSNNNNSYPNFISPDDAFVTLDAKAILPLKAKLKDLHYEKEFDAFKFIEEMNYLKSTTLQFYIESSLPAELSANLYLIDSNNVLIDTLLTSPLVISSPIVDSQGHILSPTSENIKVTLDDSKYNSLKKAKKIKLSATLNTSKDNQNQQRYVRFSNDAKIKIKASVSAVGNISF
ncbi:MAG: hypothetical protein IKV46_00740 [Bacteroidales bacterium]|nr:hypothetical protein [Bacteroidales bacterium]